MNLTFLFIIIGLGVAGFYGYKKHEERIIVMQKDINLLANELNKLKFKKKKNTTHIEKTKVKPKEEDGQE